MPEFNASPFKIVGMCVVGAIALLIGKMYDAVQGPPARDDTPLKTKLLKEILK